MKKFIFLFAILPFLMGSCATIVSGHKQMVSFSSGPSEAKIIIDGKEIGTTPLTTKVKRTARVIKFRKEGYTDAEYVMNRRFNGWFIGNILIGGPIGMIVDLINGAYVHTDANVYKDLQKK